MNQGPVKYEDLFEFTTAGDIQPSPEGGCTAFVVSTPDEDEDTYTSNIWIHCSGEEPQQLTRGGKDNSPRWSPDGRTIAFLSGRRDGKDSLGPQLYVISVEGGEARKLTDDLKGAANPRWAPDGEEICLVASCSLPEESTEDLRSALADDDEEDGADAFSEAQPETNLRFIHRLRYRFDGLGYFDDRRRHLYLVPVPHDSSECGDGRFLTSGQFDVGDFEWHPDGDRIAFLTNREDDADFSMRNDIWQVNLHDDESLIRLVYSDGAIWGIAWAPDGKRLAYIGNDGRYDHATQNDLWLYDDASGEVEKITENYDRAVGSQLLGDVRSMDAAMRPQWRPDGRCIYFTAVDRGNVPIFAVELTGSTEEPAVRNMLPGISGAAGALAAGSEHLYFTYEEPTAAPEVFALPYDAGEETTPEKLTAFNADLMRDLDVQPYERIQYSGPDGLEIEGFVCFPPNFDPAEKYPLVLYIHGGPHGAYGNTFSVEVQARAAGDRIILLTNPRGSGGYGQEFMRACVGDWGGKDYEDIMLGVDEMVGRGIVDTDRMAVTGISYGGYMTNWTVTHTDRFACAITEMCVSNLLSFYGTSDIGTHFLEAEIPGSPWESPENLWNHSPIKYIEECSTPTMVIHGDADWRCPIEQGEQVFASLKRRGVDTAMVRFPGCSHVFSRIGSPSQRKKRFRVMEAWLMRYGIDG